MDCNGIGVCNFKCRYDFGFKYYNDMGCTKYFKMHFENSWGKVLYTLAKTNAGEQCGLFWNISAQYISEHSVMESMIISMIITIFGITFLGIFLLCCSLFF